MPKKNLFDRWSTLLENDEESIYRLDRSKRKYVGAVKYREIRSKPHWIARKFYQRLNNRLSQMYSKLGKKKGITFAGRNNFGSSSTRVHFHVYLKNKKERKKNIVERILETLWIRFGGQSRGNTGSRTTLRDTVHRSSMITTC